MKIHQFSDGYLGIHTLREDVRQKVAAVPGVYRARFTDSHKRNYLEVKLSVYADRAVVIHDLSIALADGQR
jgi:hypothetical protein